MTEEDIKGLPCFQVSIMHHFLSSSTYFYNGLVFSIELVVPFLCKNETLIAIKAPHGTTLEVPDPDEVSQDYHVFSECTCNIFLFSLIYYWNSPSIHTRPLTIHKGDTG